MADLLVICDTNRNRLESAVSQFKDLGHDVNTIKFHEDFPAFQGSDEKPDLLLVAGKNEDTRDIFDKIQRRGIDFPAVIPADDVGAANADLAAEAFYVPLDCNLEGTLKLVQSVLSVWHDN